MAASSIWWSASDGVWKCKLLTDKANVAAAAIARGNRLTLDVGLFVLEDASLWYWDGEEFIRAGA